MKDKFLRSKIQDDADGWVPLDLFLSFNKWSFLDRIIYRIKEITSKVDDLVNALSKSSKLELDKTKSKVRRQIPFKEREISTGLGVLSFLSIDCCVYVENISTFWDQDKVKEVFQNFGSVAYVSLPRDTKTKQFKGFGFVEFETGFLWVF